MVTAEEVYASIATRENRLAEAARYIQDLEREVASLREQVEKLGGKKVRPQAGNQ